MVGERERRRARSRSSSGCERCRRSARFEGEDPSPCSSQAGVCSSCDSLVRVGIGFSCVRSSRQRGRDEWWGRAKNSDR